ncbi:MAG: UDP-N-acetylmuramoyl-L-alanyl-D-glutamate--2,6-diaminopimelate ligase [Bacillota bacterium]
MKLEALLSGVEVKFSSVGLNKEITALTMHSQKVEYGSMFFAIIGINSDGNNYINEVTKCGGVVVTDKPTATEIPHILVANVREAMGIISANFYGNCYKNMHFVGIVGTNGKTTTSYIIQQILRGAGIKAVVFGTLGCNMSGEVVDYGLTSPDAIDLHCLLQKAYANGITNVVIEVSAHAIYHKKMHPICVDIAVFTNLSQDHLDFFGSMDKYSACKKRFFTKECCKVGVVNADDKVGKEIMDESNINIITYGIENPSDCFAMDIVENNDGCNYIININDEISEITSNLFGTFNIYNTLGAIATCRAMGVKMEDIVNVIAQTEQIDGRFNILDAHCRIVIDFAHTPDGMANLLRVARTICKGDLIVVFGCGGNRDKGKRPIMGAIAAEYADFAVITSDNCRYEDPFSIIEDIVVGVKNSSSSTKYICIVDRKEAISHAMAIAKTDDVIVVCGKGGENYIEEKGIKKPYSDKKVVEEVIRRCASE